MGWAEFSQTSDGRRLSGQAITGQRLQDVPSSSASDFSMAAWCTMLTAD